MVWFPVPNTQVRHTATASAGSDAGGMTVLPHTHRPTWGRFPAIRFALPRGPLDLVRQVLIVSIFDVVYELSRVVAVGDRSDALRHARSVVHTEQSLGIFHELSVQRFVAHAPGVVSHVANWTYFNAQFTITFSFLLWAYLFRNDRFTTVRNAIIAADAIGVVGYILYPTAPPRMLTDMGFTDTLNQTAVNNHSSVISALSNPYAAMPSLHTAYALILGVSGVVLARHRWTKAIWALYPALVDLLDRRHRQPLLPRRRGRCRSGDRRGKHRAAAAAADQACSQLGG